MIHPLRLTIAPRRPLLPLLPVCAALWPSLSRAAPPEEAPCEIAPRERSAPAAPLAASRAAPAAARVAAGVPFSGVVRKKGDRDPLGGVRVSISNKGGFTAEARTDAEGRFAFADVPAGEIEVSLSGKAGLKQRTTERLSAGRATLVTYYAALPESPFRMVVRGERLRKEVVERVLDVSELKRIPGNQNDVLKAVQNLPGVARPPFGGGLLVVWGSAPGDTRAYADGLFIPRLYHFGGLRSTINAEFVSEVVFRPGAYGADFGRGMGGIINVTTRQPRQDRFHGSITLDFIDGSLTVEGPITKNLHFAAGARVSWISVFLPLFNTSDFQISPNYWDYQLALRYKPTKRDDIDLFVFGSTDNVGARIENPDPTVTVNIDSKSYFGRARILWTHRFSDRLTLTVMPSVGGDTLRLDTGDFGIAGRVVKVDTVNLSYNLRAELRHELLPNLDYAAGVDLEAARISVDVVAPNVTVGNMMGGPVATSPPANALSLREASVFHLVLTAPYLITRFRLLGGRLLISPQLRLAIDHITSYEGEVARTKVRPEPRLLLMYSVIPGRLSLKAGVGIYNQLPQGAQLTRRFGNPLLDWQVGTTYVAGLDMNLTSTLYIEAQAFYKDLRQLVVPSDETRYDNGGLGRVYGGEMLIRQRLWKGLFGWVAYTLSRSERRDRPEDPWRLFQFDQTHILTLVVSYKLPFWGLEAGARFRYVTGNPTTPVLGGNRNLEEQTYEDVRGAVFSARLPDFHQLDVRIDKTFTFNRWKLGIFLDVQNIYNQPNTETLVYGGRQRYQEARVTGLPIFPDLGLRADF